MTSGPAWARQWRTAALGRHEPLAQVGTNGRDGSKAATSQNLVSETRFRGDAVKLQWDRWPPVPLRGGWRPFQTQVTAVTELGTSRGQGWPKATAKRACVLGMSSSLGGIGKLTDAET